MDNRDISVPTVLPLGSTFDIDYTARANGGKSLRGLDIMAPGILVVKDTEGNQAIYDFSGLTAGVPYRLGLQIKTIVGNGSGSVGDGVTGTDIALADMIGLH